MSTKMTRTEIMILALTDLCDVFSGTEVMEVRFAINNHLHIIGKGSINFVKCNIFHTKKRAFSVPAGPN
jgi:hypothetical protein